MFLCCRHFVTPTPRGGGGTGPTKGGRFQGGRGYHRMSTEQQPVTDHHVDSQTTHSTAHCCVCHWCSIFVLYLCVCGVCAMLSLQYTVWCSPKHNNNHVPPPLPPPVQPPPRGGGGCVTWPMNNKKSTGNHRCQRRRRKIVAGYTRIQGVGGTVIWWRFPPGWGGTVVPGGRWTGRGRGTNCKVQPLQP